MTINVVIFLYCASSALIGVGAYIALRQRSQAPTILQLWCIPILIAVFWPAVISLFLGKVVLNLAYGLVIPQDQVDAFLLKYRNTKTCADLPGCKPVNSGNDKQITANRRQQITALWISHFGKKCMDCGATMNRTNNHMHQATIDHIKARRFGGTHDLKNLRVICSKCNMAKGRLEVKVDQ